MNEATELKPLDPEILNPRAKPNLACCGNCRYFRLHPNRGHLGDCRKSPPACLIVPVGASKLGQLQTASVSSWPPVRNHQWCGEWSGR